MKLRGGLLLVLLGVSPATFATDVFAEQRALLVGISDYASFRRPASLGVVGRSWPNLEGPLHDVERMSELLQGRYGFEPAQIHRLTDRHATREAILAAIERLLIRPAGPGDHLVFFFAGHGTQVFNSRSREPDRLDEALVPADSAAGVRDLRDKELRRLFQKALDRGAGLTILLDACHSSSGVRAESADRARPRSIRPDLRDIRDADEGPPLEERGALVLAAAQDSRKAYEIREGDRTYGAFTWALGKAVALAPRGEPAQQTFLRLSAILRTAPQEQRPSLAGNESARMAALFGEEAGPAGGSAFAVERSLGPDRYGLQGGWVHGLAPGARLVAGKVGATPQSYEVQEMVGAGRAIVAKVSGSPPGRPLEVGEFLEVETWVLPEASTLRVWLPEGPRRADLAERLRLLGVEVVVKPAEAHYLLARARDRSGRSAWLRRKQEGLAGETTLPHRSDWIADGPNANAELATRLSAIVRLKLWLDLETRSEPSPFRLGVRELGGSLVPPAEPLVATKVYEPVLVPTGGKRVDGRQFFYVFSIDAWGRLEPMYPPYGDENRLADRPAGPIPLVEATFEVVKPFAIDYYLLLTTSEPLSDAWILDRQGGFRNRGEADRGQGILRQLLEWTEPGERAVRVLAATPWALTITRHRSVAAPPA